MGMTNREEQEVRRGKRKKTLPSPPPPEKLASESIMSDERDTTVCTTSYPIPPTLLELGRPKVDNMLRSFFLSLSLSSHLSVRPTEIEEGEFSTAYRLFPPSTPPFPQVSSLCRQWPRAMRRKRTCSRLWQSKFCVANGDNWQVAPASI